MMTSDPNGLRGGGRDASGNVRSPSDNSKASLAQKGRTKAHSRRKFAEDRRHKLRDRRVNRHHARVGGSRHARGHSLDHPMDGFVASHAKNSAAEDRVRVAVDHDFHESLRFALLDGTADAGHWPPAYADRVAFGPGFGLGQAHPAKRWVDVERVNGDAVAHFALGAVEQVRRSDLEIIVRRVGESAPAVAIAKRPNMGDAGLQRLVDDDIAVRVDLDACGFEPEVVGVGATPDREQYMRAYDFRFA